MPKANSPVSPVFDEPVFAEFFAADQQVTSRKFMVGDREAVLEFRPMDSGARRRYESAGFTYSTKIDAQSGVPAVELTDVDMAARELFLVKATLIGGFTWRANKVVEDGVPTGEIAWTQENIPTNQAQRDRYVEANLVVTGPVWEWLVGVCEKVNGLDAATAKN